MLGETDTMTLIDREKCKRFLRWMENKPDAAHMANFEKILRGTDTDPFATFVTGLKAMSAKMDDLENPLIRIMSNPAFMFQTGLLLGYAMACGSGHPEFSELLSSLENKTHNVTPITAAKGFSHGE